MTATTSAASHTRSPTIFLTQVDSIQRIINLQMREKYKITRKKLADSHPLQHLFAHLNRNVGQRSITPTLLAKNIYN